MMNEELADDYQIMVMAIVAHQFLIGQMIIVCCNHHQQGERYDTPLVLITYALPTWHAALGRAASTPRGAGCQSVCRHPRQRRQVLAVAIWCTGTNLVQQHVYAQVAHSFLTDSMIVTNTSSIPVTRNGKQCPTRRIVSTVGTAAWLPHAKLRDTGMTSGQGNPFGA